MPCTEEQVELGEIMKGFAKSFVQNRDLTKGDRMESNSSWTDPCCSFPECSNDLNFESRKVYESKLESGLRARIS